MYKIYSQDKVLFFTENKEELDKKIDELLQSHRLIEAAGGLVKNPANECLFIFRRGKWDLPKGKIDADETPEAAALREVEEECGIDGLDILGLASETYHVYPTKNGRVLKKTYWYAMFCRNRPALFPQQEEDITEAKWIKKEEAGMVSSNTYPLINDLLALAY